MNKQERIEAFLKELTELSQKHKVFITGSYDGPELEVCDAEVPGRYTNYGYSSFLYWTK